MMGNNLIFFFTQSIKTQPPTASLEVKGLEDLLSTQIPLVNLETCQNPKWGEVVQTDGKTGQLISTRAAIFRNPQGEIVGYYTGYYNHRTKTDEMGIFFDRSGNPVATLGKPRQPVPASRLIEIYDFKRPEIKVGELEVHERSPVGANETGDPRFNTSQPYYHYAVRGLKDKLLAESVEFSATAPFSFENDHDPLGGEYLGAIAEINPEGRVVRLLGLIKFNCK